MKLYFAVLTGADETPDLLSSCIQYTQFMRLSRGNVVDSLCDTVADRQRTKRAFWFLYCIEKEFCLRAEICPILDEDFVDYRPPQLEVSPGAVDWLFIRCCYASLCTAILKGFYGQKSLKAEGQNLVNNLEAQLNAWLRLLPPGIQSIDEQMVEFPSLNDWQERRKKLTVFFQYHAVFLTLHTGRRSQHPPSSSCSSEFPGIEPWALDTSRKSAAAVRRILAASCQLTESDVRLDPSMYRLVCIATCSLAAATIRTPLAGHRTDLSYLATAAGFFGRMALANIEGPLEEITEIVRIAQQHIKARQQDMATD
ncbi:uncharacterized protein N7511_008253 [Penicillium nucicola]|uniref:uncharacterized protein n=1 Tax=Penicillium nucicola TaxID=1850975 RepID=UPI00254536AD|nr:uncharacterized protein N7511_008253 [Penicillium nucicola]KAJ5754100.1 hypothetical protein N7511_008253 [Penicillium nucicola]